MAEYRYQSSYRQGLALLIALLVILGFFTWWGMMYFMGL